MSTQNKSQKAQASSVLKAASPPRGATVSPLSRVWLTSESLGSHRCSQIPSTACGLVTPDDESPQWLRLVMGAAVRMREQVTPARRWWTTGMRTVSLALGLCRAEAGSL